MVECGYDCYTIGGPWIAENPDCPIHGSSPSLQVCDHCGETIDIDDTYCPHCETDVSGDVNDEQFLMYP